MILVCKFSNQSKMDGSLRYSHQSKQYKTDRSTMCPIIFSSLNSLSISSQSPYPSLLNFWKIKFEKSSLTNWILTCPVWNRPKIKFVEIDFSNLIFQKSSTEYRWIGQISHYISDFFIWLEIISFQLLSWFYFSHFQKKLYASFFSVRNSKKIGLEK